MQFHSNLSTSSLDILHTKNCHTNLKFYEQMHWTEEWMDKPKVICPLNFFKSGGIKRWFHELTLVCVMYLGLGFRLSVSVSLLDQDASHHEICTGTPARWFPWHPLKENFHLGLAETESNLSLS